MIPFRILRLFLLICLCAISLCACERESLLADDLQMAREAALEREWPLAERLLERYLRGEQDPAKRWDAWALMLEAINAASPKPRASLECLEAMRDEYEGDEAKQAQILARMGKFNEQLRRYDLAAKAWEGYLDLGELDGRERVEGYRRLAAMQFAQRHFEAGEESLQQCLALPLSDHDKIHCMLDMADQNMARERWQEVADLCQQILDSDPDPRIMGMAGYLRGDALEQMGNRAEALRQFEAARDNYPNPAVMDNRINYLKKQIRNNGRDKQ